MATALLAESYALLDGVEAAAALPPAAAHALYLATLAYFVTPERYLADAAAYERLVPTLAELYAEVPQARRAGAALPGRAIAEDLQDSESEALQALGSRLLEALEGGG